MRPVSPVIPGGDPVEIKVGESQPEFITLPTFHAELTNITRWRLTDEERALIASGADLFLGQITYGGPAQPLLPLILPEDEILPTVLACEEDLIRKTGGRRL